MQPDKPNQMVGDTCDIKEALPDGIKPATPSKWKNREVARKGLLTAKEVVFREVLTEVIAAGDPVIKIGMHD